MLWQVFLVGAGGFAGSVCRFGVGRMAYGLWPGAALPYGTLAVNVLGCFLIGLVTGWFAGRGPASPPVQALLLTGFLGGFTTFSAFGYETVALVREATPETAALNVVLHLGAGLGAVWAGASVFR